MFRLSLNRHNIQHVWCFEGHFEPSPWHPSRLILKYFWTTNSAGMILRQVEFISPTLHLRCTWIRHGLQEICQARRSHVLNPLWPALHWAMQNISLHWTNIMKSSPPRSPKRKAEVSLFKSHSRNSNEGVYEYSVRVCVILPGASDSSSVPKGNKWWFHLFPRMKWELWSDKTQNTLKVERHRGISDIK